MRSLRTAVFVSVAAALLLPAAALAKPAKGTVLELSRGDHVMRTVADGDVDSYKYAGRLDRKIRAGSRVRFDARGQRASRVKRIGSARKARFRGRVVSVGKRAALISLPDGRPFRIGGNATGARASHDVSVVLEGLRAGQTVDITVMFGSDGSLTIRLRIVEDTPVEEPPAEEPEYEEPEYEEPEYEEPEYEESPGAEEPPVEDTPADCLDNEATSGRVIGVNRLNGTFAVRRIWGDDYTFSASRADLDRLHRGDEVFVDYTTTERGLSADLVRIVWSALVEPDTGYYADYGLVAWIGFENRQFSLAREGQSRLLVDATCFLLCQLWKGEDVRVIYHEDETGDLVADAIDPWDTN